MLLLSLSSTLLSTTMVLYVFLIAFLLIALLQHYINNWAKYAVSRKIPGPVPFPFVGNIPQLFLNGDIDVVKFLIALGNRADRMFRIWIGSELLVVVSDPNDCKIVMAECINRSVIYHEMESVLGEGLFNLRDNVWKDRRRMLNPTMNYQHIVSFEGNFNSVADDTVKHLSLGKDCYLDIIDRAMLNNIFCEFEFRLVIDFFNNPI